MFSCYRRIPHFVSKNIRLRTLYCETTKLSPVHNDEIDDILSNSDKETKTEYGHFYRMLRVHDKLRVLVFRDSSKSLEDEYVGCTIRVSVGSNDDPDKCLGLAHLLEHVLVRASYKICDSYYKCETKRFHTFYSFHTSDKHYAAVLNALATVLFTESNLVDVCGESVKHIVGQERESVDNEFHEKRILDNYRAAFEIFQACPVGMHLPKFAYGTRDTLNLKNDDDKLLKELDKIRTLQHQRPVVICIYSKHKLDMETILKSLNVGDVKKPQSTKAQPSLKAKRHRKKDDGKIKSLIVAKSPDNDSKLTLIFPIMMNLNVQEKNTFDWIAKMIEWGADGLLKTKLRDSRLATGCWALLHDHDFFINVRLTKKGLEQIRYVSNTIKCYLNFLCHEWMGSNINRCKTSLKTAEGYRYGCQLKTSIEKSEYIAARLNENRDEFDEEALFSGLEGEDGANLISKHLLKNENIAYMISDRSFKNNVWQHIAKHHSDGELTATKHRQSLFGREFFIVQSEWLQSSGDDYSRDGCNDFKWKEFNSYTETLSYYTYMAEPKEVAFRSLIGRHLVFYFDRYQASLQNIDIEYKKPEILTIFASSREAKEANKKITKLFTKSAHEFTLVKQDLLADCLRIMNNSEKLAESLMDTVVQNIHYKRKIDPLPLQYNTLLSTKYEDYCQYWRRMNELNEEQKAGIDEHLTIYPRTFNLDIQPLKSINANDTVTATLIFYQTSQLLLGHESGSMNSNETEYNISLVFEHLSKEVRSIRHEIPLYTATVKRQSYNHVDGVLCKILSLESKSNQNSERINQRFEDILTNAEDAARDDFRYETCKLHRVFNSLKERRIKIQVIGHEEPKVNKFKKQFKSWLKKHETAWEQLKRTEKRKPKPAKKRTKAT